MAASQSPSLLHALRQTLLRRHAAGLSDGQLLRSFLDRQDEAAFEALVHRHGPMVRGVCRRVLRDSHDADDAFQAAFLVLLRKAATLTTREVIGDWLHGVAYRTALKARSAAARRRLKERQVIRSEAIHDEEPQTDWRPLLDQEIARLPEKYRLPIVLCDLQERTRREAAQQLGWPEGTLSGRLSRARAMLARRLTRRGVALSAAALVAGLASEASARLPFSLIGSTCRAAMGFAAGSTAETVPASVAALTEGVVKAMLLSKMKKLVAVGMIVFVLTAGLGAWHYAAVAGQTEKPRKEKASPRVETPRDQAKVARVAPGAKRSFQIDLELVREEKGQRKLLAAPRLITLDGREAIFRMGDPYLYTIGDSQFEEVVMGPSVRAKVHSLERGKLCLILTVSQPLRWFFEQGVTVESRSVNILRRIEPGQPITVKVPLGDKDQSILKVTATVRAADRADRVSDTNPLPPPTYSGPPIPETTAEKVSQENSIATAQKDYQTAEFYRRSGHPDSARFYYELIRRRYPDTLYAERARERLGELKKIEEKPPARVGQIFIVGNKKIPDEVFLKNLGLYPGQILTFPDLEIAEGNLGRLKGFKSKPRVTVLDRDGEGEFKDIQITVEEK